MVDFANRSDVDYRSRYILAGIDHAWSQRLSTSHRAAAELFSSDRTEQTAPYGEFALDYAMDRTTSVRWFNALGFDGGQISPSITENSILVSAGLSYLLWSNVSMNAQYSYTVLDSDDNTGGTGQLGA